MYLLKVMMKKHGDAKSLQVIQLKFTIKPRSLVMVKCSWTALRSEIVLNEILIKQLLDLIVLLLYGVRLVIVPFIMDLVGASI